MVLGTSAREQAPRRVQTVHLWADCGTTLLFSRPWDSGLAASHRCSAVCVRTRSYGANRSWTSNSNLWRAWPSSRLQACGFVFFEPWVYVTFLYGPRDEGGHVLQPGCRLEPAVCVCGLCVFTRSLGVGRICFMLIEVFMFAHTDPTSVLRVAGARPDC